MSNSLFYGDYETVVRLIREGVSSPTFPTVPIDVNVRNNWNETPLHTQQDIKIIKVLLEAGANVNTIDQSCYTPLHWKRNVEVVELLIQSGADVNTRSFHNWTPLHLIRDIKTAEALIKAGANVNAVDEFNNTPLFYQDTLEVIKFLIQKGADVNIKNTVNRTPLDTPRVKKVYDEIVSVRKLILFCKRNFKYFVFKHWISSREGVEWLYHPKRCGKYVQANIMRIIRER